MIRIRSHQGVRFRPHLRPDRGEIVCGSPRRGHRLDWSPVDIVGEMLHPPIKRPTGKRLIAPRRPAEAPARAGGRTAGSRV